MGMLISLHGPLVWAFFLFRSGARGVSIACGKCVDRAWHMVSWKSSTGQSRVEIPNSFLQLSAWLICYRHRFSHLGCSLLYEKRRLVCTHCKRKKKVYYLLVLYRIVTLLPAWNSWTAQINWISCTEYVRNGLLRRERNIDCRCLKWNMFLINKT